MDFIYNFNIIIYLRHAHPFTYKYMYVVNYYVRLVLHMYMMNLLWMLLYGNLELCVYVCVGVRVM